MAKILSFGGLRPQGKSGGFTFYEMDGQTIMRKLPSANHRNKTHPTPLQLLYRQRFREINTFLKPIKQVLNFGFQNQSTKSRKGIQCAFQNLVNKGYTFWQEPRIDPAFLKISEGPLLGAENGQAIRSGNIIQITWADNSGQGSSYFPDNCMVFILHPESGASHWVKEVGTRSAMQAEITLPEKDLGKTWCVYLAFYRKKGTNVYTFSDSSYLGRA